MKGVKVTTCLYTTIPSSSVWTRAMQFVYALRKAPLQPLPTDSNFVLVRSSAATGIAIQTAPVPNLAGHSTRFQKQANHLVDMLHPRNCAMQIW